MKCVINQEDSDGQTIAEKSALLGENRAFVKTMYERIKCPSYVADYEEIMGLCYAFQYFNDYMLMAQSTWYLLQTIYLANLTLCNFGVLTRDHQFRTFIP